MKLLIMQFSAISCHFTSKKHKIKSRSTWIAAQQ
jgi:hypothetical protein